MKKLIIVILLAVAAIGGYRIYRDRATPAGAPRSDASSVTSGNAVQVGRQALLWHTADGGNSLWRFDPQGAAVTFPVQAAAAGWTPLAFAANGWSGADTVLWRNDASGELRLWQLAGESDPPSTILPPAGQDWRVAALIDADGDADSDLVWVNTNGAVAVWTLQDGAVVDRAVVGETGGGWALAATGDFDHDGRADLFWRKDDGSLAAIWALDGVNPPATRTLADAGGNWTVMTAASLDATPGDDLLWRDAAGNLAGWSSADAKKTLVIGRSIPVDWTFVAALDTDGDERAELLWRNPKTSQVGAWMRADDGTVVDRALTPVGQEWRAVPSGSLAR